MLFENFLEVLNIVRNDTELAVLEPNVFEFVSHQYLHLGFVKRGANLLIKRDDEVASGDRFRLIVQLGRVCIDLLAVARLVLIAVHIDNA